LASVRVLIAVLLMCFLYDLHEYIETFKKNNNIKNDISNDIDYVEDNIIELYYKNKLYDINEQVNTILTPLIIENKYNRLEELLDNIITIYHTNKDKKKEYYSYILHIKNITIE
jgi:hypothetical protein